MKMRSDGTDGQIQGIGDLIVGAFFLMIEDENGALDLAEALEVLFDGLLELMLLDLLFGIAAGVREAVLPAGGVVGEGDESEFVAAAAFPLVLSNVDGDAVEIGGEEGFAAKAGEGAVEAEEDLLGEVVDVFPAAGEPQKGAEDHRLVVAYHLLEG
jgi:hypothetical protein